MTGKTEGLEGTDPFGARGTRRAETKDEFPVLVYDGVLAPAVAADGFFDALVSASDLFGLPAGGGRFSR